MPGQVTSTAEQVCSGTDDFLVVGPALRILYLNAQHLIIHRVAERITPRYVRRCTPLAGDYSSREIKLAATLACIPGLGSVSSVIFEAGQRHNFSVARCNAGIPVIHSAIIVVINLALHARWSLTPPSRRHCLLPFRSVMCTVVQHL